MRWHNRPVSDRNVSIPQWTPTQREIDDLDLLLDGAIPPLRGFVDPSASPGTNAPITLHVRRETAEVAIGVGTLDLIDPEGAPLGRLTVESTYDASTPEDADLLGVAGPVERLAHNEFGPFRRLHLSPDQVHADTPRDQLSAVMVTRALTGDDLSAIREVAASTGRTPLLLTCVGHDMPRGLSAPALVRAGLAAADLIGPDARVVAVPVADHGDANAALLSSVAEAYGTVDLALPAEPTGEPPETIRSIVEGDRPPRHRQGLVIFFTGLSGSGKSTLARALVDHILERGERTVTSLDGDVVRHHLSEGLGFSRKDRETNIVRIGFVAAEISRHGGVAVCSPIAPFDATRAEVRRMTSRAGGGFVLIHVSTPLEECERRDRKGLYAKARAGEIPDFTGISSPYEPPTDAIKIDTTDRDIAVCSDEILTALISEGWLNP
ncbi:MAG: adenylyl-sulfate kinase [Nocardioidaceae bacterium]|nr:adenylyl-sulfate kinase [Nocardioidaceae bacterium]